MKLNNSVKLIGNMGADPEVRRLEGGKIVANINLATNDHYRNAVGEKVTNTQWHRLVAWGKIAENFEKYTKKGTMIAIDGKLIHSSYEDREGISRYKTEIMVNELMLLSKFDASTDEMQNAKKPATA